MRLELRTLNCTSYQPVSNEMEVTISGKVLGEPNSIAPIFNRFNRGQHAVEVVPYEDEPNPSLAGAADQLFGVVMAFAHPDEFNQPTKADMEAAMDNYQRAIRAT